MYYEYKRGILYINREKIGGGHMLMRFSVSNFLSFGYKVNEKGEEISDDYKLYAGRSEQHGERMMRFGNRKVLKFSSLYGANASGKTNLIHAIDTGKMILLRTMEGVDLHERYCRSKKENKERSSLFEYEFTVGDRCYAYGFKVNLEEGVVLSEWLSELYDSGERSIFGRISDGNQYYFDEKMFTEQENIEQFHFFIQDANRIKTSLLIYEIKRRNLEHRDYAVFLDIYHWFQKKLTIIYPETTIGSSYFLFGNGNEELIKILDYFDTGITGYDMRKLNEEAFYEYFHNEKLAKKLLNDIDKRRNGHEIIATNHSLFEIRHNESDEREIEKLLFQHGEDENKYEYGEESDGTKRLIELMDVLLNDDGERVFIIDELDRSLHPQMTIKFVETFLKFSKKKRTQLVITTHESNLMDLNILRRDEIWFAEKEKDNTTHLYTLEAFKIRYDKVVSKGYLAGRYGAVPVFKDFEYVWGRDSE